MTIEGLSAPLELGAESLVARAARIDPVSRTASVLFALGGATSQPVVGTTARVELATTEERKALAVPEKAIVDDGAALVVFVQPGGESFERRIVQIGLRYRGYAEIVTGVRAGERVVSRGAWSVKLAASGGAEPAHGHAH